MAGVQQRNLPTAGFELARSSIALGRCELSTAILMIMSPTIRDSLGNIYK